jgi:hypothetical protein
MRRLKPCRTPVSIRLRFIHGDPGWRTGMATREGDPGRRTGKAIREGDPGRRPGNSKRYKTLNEPHLDKSARRHDPLAAPL